MARMAPAPCARSNRLLSPNRINDARMSRLVPRANRGGVAWAVGGCAGQLAGQLAVQLAGQLADQPANQFADQLADQTLRSSP